MIEYLAYQEHISAIPEFLYKYLDLEIMTRLKDISVLCGMDYASKHIYDFKFYMSRFNHSLNVALITWRLTYDKTQTLAALFHDVSTPVFSHVIDYMNGDYIKQESTEDKTKDVLYSSDLLSSYLKEDEVDINNIIDFKKYPVVDSPRPALCADRIDNLVDVGMAWAKCVKYRDAKDIIDNLYYDKQSNEIGLYSEYIGHMLSEINYKINVLTHSNEDTFMMVLLSDIVKLLIDEGIIKYNDLYQLTEHQMLRIIRKHLDNPRLNEMYDIWKNVEYIDKELDIDVKELTLNPLILGRRLK